MERKCRMFSLARSLSLFSFFWVFHIFLRIPVISISLVTSSMNLNIICKSKTYPCICYITTTSDPAPKYSLFHSSRHKMSLFLYIYTLNRINWNCAWELINIWIGVNSLSRVLEVNNGNFLLFGGWFLLVYRQKYTRNNMPWIHWARKYANDLLTCKICNKHVLCM